jgi:hypothetical protein
MTDSDTDEHVATAVGSENRIEQKLKNLLEQTRRKIINYDNNNEVEEGDTPISED